jgi:hypothetical protein
MLVIPWAFNWSGAPTQFWTEESKQFWNGGSTPGVINLLHAAPLRVAHLTYQ